MNSKNNKTSNLLVLNLADKISLQRNDKYIALPNFIIYYTWKNIKNSQKDNLFSLSASTWSENLELPDGSYFESDFEYITKIYEKFTDNIPIQIHINKIEKRTLFKVKLGCYLKITWEHSQKKAKDENGENLPHLEITEVILLQPTVVL